MSEVAALMIQASNAGVAHYRLDSWAQAAYRLRAGHFFIPWYDKSLDETHPWESDLLDTRYRTRIKSELASHAKTAKVLVSQMCHTEPALIELVELKCLNKIPLVTEIDDNILSTPTYNVAHSTYRPGSAFRSLAIDQFRMSDAMIVSTPYLKEVYSEFNPNIYVIPNSLDFRIWDNLKHRRNTDFIRIGWAGGKTHEEDLRIVEPIVRKTLERHTNVRFSFVCGVPKFFRGIDRVETIDEGVRIDRYPQFLASRSFDIGLAPLVDNAFNRGKSNLRWLEYAGLKVPCVASNVGHFAETITQDHDGILCENQNEGEWLEALEWLISDEKERRRMGKAANQTARRKFNVEANVFEYAKVLNEIIDRGQVVKLPESQEASA